jgi:subtilase family serine protease
MDYSSTPGSANYGKHWTSEEVIDMFKPSEETVSAVHDWLVASGISSERITHSENKGWLAFDASTAEVEDLLHTEYHEYEVKGTGDKTAACDEYVFSHDFFSITLHLTDSKIDTLSQNTSSVILTTSLPVSNFWPLLASEVSARKR